MRTPKVDVAPAVSRRQATELIEQVRHYQIITPLYGGGVKPAEADPVSVVRGTEIRGQLRFWWRATRGGTAEGSLEKLRELEGALWGTATGGGTSGPSKVQVAVRVEAKGALVAPFRIERGRPAENPEAKVPAYAAFPLQPTKEEMRGQLKQVRTGVAFALILQYPKAVAQEVEAAVWAWETFGGIGARTRRGFGALHCRLVEGQKTESFTRANTRAALEAQLKHFVVSGKWPENVPHLSPKLRFRLLDAADANTAWRTLIQKLREFRQMRRGGPYGQSLWPEAEMVYELFRRPANRLRPPRLVRSFPRAQFGLPIQFEFPQHPDGPGKTMLRGKKVMVEGKEIIRDRLASPLILRPLICSDGAIGLAAVLMAPPFLKGGLVLEETTSGKTEAATAQINENDAKEVVPLKGATNVLFAFLDYLKGK